MKYPHVLFFRHSEYEEIDDVLMKNIDRFQFKITVIKNHEDLLRLFDSDHSLLITFGGSDDEYCDEVNQVIANEMRKRWLHFKVFQDIDDINRGVLFCFFHYITRYDYSAMRRVFSIFTTCFNSFEKIHRAYDSLKKQTLRDWEWVIVDDSPEDIHFDFLRGVFKEDSRVRLYRRNGNSGNIGNVKNEAVSLCRGKYLLELDHDDEILPDTLKDAARVFDSDPDIGFVYMDFFNIYEDGTNYRYGDFYGLGYAGYYRQKYENKWVYVSITPNINNVTLSHIVGVPNHPRMWRRETMFQIGNYSEFLPVADDYELLLRTAVHTKMVKIPKIGYIQYMNANDNNFSLIRNDEIQKLVHHLREHCFKNYNIEKRMKFLDAFDKKEDCPIWKLGDYTSRYCNQIINLDYDRQYCVIGLETLHRHKEEIDELYQDERNDFLVLDNAFNSDCDRLCIELENLGYDRMKCYSMDDCSDEQLESYFRLMYLNCTGHKIFNREKKISYLVYN